MSLQKQMIKYKILSSLAEVLSSKLDDKSPVFCDIETGGLYVDIRLIQLYQPANDEVYIIDMELLGHEHLNIIKAYMSNFHTVWFNASYDLGTLNMLTAKIDDLYYLSKLAFPLFDKFGLADIAENLGYDLYGDLDKKSLQKAKFKLGTLLTSDQLRYSATDVVILSKLWGNSQIQKWRKSEVYKLDIRSLRYCIQYQQNGIPMNTKMVEEALSVLEGELQLNQEGLDMLGYGGLNVNSPKQCVAALGTESSDKKTLIELMQKENKLAKAIYERRRLLKKQNLLQTYNKPKVYTKYNPAGAATGRFTATGGDLPDGINGQQIPRDLIHLINPADNNFVVISRDYATLEIRLACAIYGDRYMYKQLMAGEDLHTSMAKSISGKSEITKEERNKAKAINFGFAFGMGAKTFKEYALVQYGITFSMQEAIRVRAKYFSLYKDIDAYHQNVYKNKDREGFLVKTALGRRAKPKRATDAINMPVQGSGAEVTKLAIHLLIEKDPIALQYIIMQVHDSIKMAVPKSTQHIWEDKLSDAMIKAWQELSKSDLFKYKDIPIMVD